MSAAPRVEVIALPTAHRVRVGDDLAALVVEAAVANDVTLADGDVVCVASKVVAIAEDRLVPLPDAGDPKDARRALARRTAARIVADSPWVLVTQTQHGFVAANDGIDASNVAAGMALLLPADPDASAAEIRDELQRLAGVDVGVLVTDTFGRPWRMGQTDVALGASGAAVLRDERGGVDLDGSSLDVTVAALADEVAGAADLVRTKASGTPFVVVRGLPPEQASGTGQDLVRPVDEDLFRFGGAQAVVEGIRARRTVRAFADRPVPDELLADAVAAAVTAPAPHHTRPWRFLRLQPDTRRHLLDAMAERWRNDLASDGLDAATIDRRIERSDAILRTAPELLAPFVTLDGAHDYPDTRRTRAEEEMFLLTGGAALGALQVTLSAHALGAAWISSTLFCPDTVRASLDLPDTWLPLGLVAVGWPAPGFAPRPRPPVDTSTFLQHR
jgi:coenzyme F420-0:L-glutamate ligase / coenzyme F420-1:gamma-L-glutamate ligase